MSLAVQVKGAFHLKTLPKDVPGPAPKKEGPRGTTHHGQGRPVGLKEVEGCPGKTLPLGQVQGIVPGGLVWAGCCRERPESMSTAQ